MSYLTIYSVFQQFTISQQSTRIKTDSLPRGPPRRHRRCRQIHHTITQTTEHPTTVAGHYNIRPRHTVALKPNNTEGAQSLHIYDAGSRDE